MGSPDQKRLEYQVVLEESDVGNDVEQRRLPNPIRSWDELGRLAGQVVDETRRRHYEVFWVGLIAANNLQIVRPEVQTVLRWGSVEVHEFDFTIGAM